MRWTLAGCALLLGCGGKVSETDTTNGDAGNDAIVVVDGTPAIDVVVPEPEPVPVDAPSPMPACPPLAPKAGEGCPVVGQECSYSTSCGGLVQARCGGSGAAFVWVLETLKPCPGTCPPKPRAYLPCDTALTCTYDGPCGKVTSECTGPGSSWQTSIGSCPSGGTCPTTEPAVGDTCLAPGKCSYSNACGSEIIYCNSSGYTLKIDYALCAGCPSKQPPNGAACSGSGPCWYENECGKRNESKCVGGAWVTTKADCTK